MASTINVKIAPLPRGEYSSSATYAKLDVVSYNGSSYMAIKAVPTGTVPTNTTYWQLLAEKPTIGEGSITTDMLADGAVTADKLDSSVSEKYAEVNGYYEDMTVGGAEQLISSVYIEDSVPYVFRTSGGSADIGDREFDEIHGGTIAWNQLYPIHTGYSVLSGSVTGLTISVTDGYLNVTGTASSNGRISVTPSVGSIPANHVCLILCDGWNGFAWGRNGFGTFAKDYFINKHTAGWGVLIAVDFVANTTYNIHARFSSYDLTQMFGTAIADYIYSLEQSNTGSGVAWFKSLFPKPYYAYNAGQLISVSGLSAHKMTGFNQWDEEWESGTIYNDGSLVNNPSYFRSKNYIPVFPSTQYYSKTPSGDSGIKFYDANKNILTGTQISSHDVLFTTPDNAHYIKFYCYGSTYNGDVCINLSWDGERNGEYEPYESHSYALDDSLTLRGIPKLNSANEMYFDGDIYSSDGTVTRKYGAYTFTGSETWTYDGSSFFQANLTGVTGKTVGQMIATNGIILKIVNSSYARAYLADNPTLSASSNMNTVFPNGSSMVYELVTPTTESAEPYQSPQIVSDWGTEEYVIAEQSGVAMPVGHETKYTSNLKAKLEMAPNSPSNGDGDYIVRQTNGINEYVPLTERIPNAPSENGNYILKCTVSGSTITYTWEAQS